MILLRSTCGISQYTVSLAFVCARFLIASSRESAVSTSRPPVDPPDGALCSSVLPSSSSVGLTPCGSSPSSSLLPCSSVTSDPLLSTSSIESPSSDSMSNFSCSFFSSSFAWQYLKSASAASSVSSNVSAFST